MDFLCNVMCKFFLNIHRERVMVFKQCSPTETVTDVQAMYEKGMKNSCSHAIIERKYRHYERNAEKEV